MDFFLSDRGWSIYHTYSNREGLDFLQHPKGMDWSPNRMGRQHTQAFNKQPFTCLTQKPKQNLKKTNLFYPFPQTNNNVLHHPITQTIFEENKLIVSPPPNQ